MIVFLAAGGATGRIKNPILKGLLQGGSPERGPLLLEKLLGGVIQIFIFIGLIIFIIYFLLGAFAWIISQGDETKVKEAKKRVENALIGLFLIFSIFALLKVLGTIFGLDWLQDLKLILLPLI